MNTEWADADRLAALREGITVVGDRDGISVEAPATGEDIGTVPACTDEDVAEATERARAAQDDWAERPIEERVAAIDRFHDLLLDRRADVTR